MPGAAQTRIALAAFCGPLYGETRRGPGTHGGRFGYRITFIITIIAAAVAAAAVEIAGRRVH